MKENEKKIYKKLVYDGCKWYKKLIIKSYNFSLVVKISLKWDMIS